MLDFLPEIESDMSVFHRIEDVYTMHAATFFRRVLCLTAYDGAVAAQHGAQQAEVVRPVREAAPTTAEDMWAQYRAKRYAGYLAPGESPKQVSVEDLVATASQPAIGW